MSAYFLNKKKTFWEQKSVKCNIKRMDINCKKQKYKRLKDCVQKPINKPNH